MRLFFILIILSSLSYAETETRDHKNGLLFGLGGSGSRYTYPADYNGTNKSKLDDKATLLGGSLHLGYDIVLKRLLLGIRGEGMILDTLGMGNKNTNSLTGKMRATNALLRAGFLFDAKMFDPVGDVSHIIFEIFIEGGITSGHKSFSKKFTDAGGDSYDEELEEEFSGQILAGGLNLTTRSGAFCELKVAHTSMNHTAQKFTGQKTEAGITTSLNRTLHDTDGFTTFSLLFGHHF